MNKKAIASELLLCAKDLLGMEFDSDAALKKYLKDHPGAEKSNHTVKKKDGEKSSPEKKDDGKVVPHEELGKLLRKWTSGGFDSISDVSNYSKSGFALGRERMKEAVGVIDGYLKNPAPEWPKDELDKLSKAKKLLEEHIGGQKKEEQKEETAPKKVKTHKDLAELLGQWHDSGSDPIYQVSSSSGGGHEVDRDVMEKALSKVKGYIANPRDEWKKSDIAQLSKAKKLMEGILKGGKS
jgi:hypothetical protein